MRRFFAALLVAAIAAPLAAQAPSAIYTDPAPNPAHPARMEVLSIPSGGVAINGVAYLAVGPGPHPTIVICHGLPGNEKNLDLAQALRRAGWNAVTFNYRGSWGSPGSFRFAQNPEDAAALLAHLRDPATAKALKVDPARIVLAGHSMGGWVAATATARDSKVLGAILISAANLGARGQAPRDVTLARMTSNNQSLAGTTPDAMADELIANTAPFDFVTRAAALGDRPLLVLTSNDGLEAASNALVAAVRQAGGGKVKTAHVATDHSWSDSRIRLQSEIIEWLRQFL